MKILTLLVVAMLGAPGGRALPGECEMRSVNFRDNVLWAIAEKDGLDPTTDLLNDIAREYVSSINAWLRRLYDVADFAEWTDIQAFTPDPTTHLISWDAIPSVLDSEGRLDPPKIGKVLKVYLLDPRTTWTPVDTPFRETKQGIYVGFDHGPAVWLKFIPRVPVFTSEVWDSSRTYGKGELTYSPAAGECYKSKANGNRGHDPSLEAVSELPMGTEVVQQQTPDNPGLLERPEIYVVDFGTISPGPQIPNPPPAGSFFFIDIYDNADTLLASWGFSGDGTQSIATIIANLATNLDAGLPPSFVVTPGATSITIENASVFYSKFSNYKPSVFAPVQTAKRVEIQAYIPVVTPSAGQQQITQLTLSPDQCVAGSTYSLTIIDGNGEEHAVEYVSLPTDSCSQVLAGIVAAVETARATQTFFNDVSMSLDVTSLRLTFSMSQPASYNVTRRPPPGSYWTLIPFPFALADQVVRGVYADVLKTEGQADKGAAEEQSVPQETQLRISAGMATGTEMITDQATARGRYSR